MGLSAAIEVMSFRLGECRDIQYRVGVNETFGGELFKAYIGQDVNDARDSVALGVRVVGLQGETFPGGGEGERNGLMYLLVSPSQ